MHPKRGAGLACLHSKTTTLQCEIFQYDGEGLAGGVQGDSGGSSHAGRLQPRRRVGRPILPVKNPSGGDLTPEQERLARRRMHNRESARRSRSKRQATFEEQNDMVNNPDCG